MEKLHNTPSLGFLPSTLGVTTVLVPSRVSRRTQIESMQSVCLVPGGVPTNASLFDDSDVNLILSEKFANTQGGWRPAVWC